MCRNQEQTSNEELCETMLLPVVAQVVSLTHAPHLDVPRFMRRNHAPASAAASHPLMLADDLDDTVSSLRRSYYRTAPGAEA